MKKAFVIILLLSVIIINSCKKKYKITDNKSEVEFIIIGTAKNGDAKKLALYIPSLGMDNRLTSEIINGKFQFKGTLPNPERAEIAFDNELEEFDGSYAVYDVFLTKDTLKIDVTIDKRFDNFFFSEKSFIDNGVNSYFQKNKDKYFDAYNGLMFNPKDSILMDSLRLYSFPKVRKNLIKLNKETFSDKQYTIIGLNNLKYMLEEREIFDFSEMTKLEKKAITEYFNTIDKKYTNTPDYIVVSSHLKRMNDDNFGKKFMNFTLPNILEKETDLDEIITKNDFTVLDFWWSGCLPCRKFNQESKEYYKTLKENGIEIISINVDDGLRKWQNASKKDNIEWVNLYAGANSKIQTDYNVVSFPTTIIFNRNKQLINFEFHKAIELLKLKK